MRNLFSMQKAIDMKPTAGATIYTVREVLLLMRLNDIIALVVN